MKKRKYDALLPRINGVADLRALSDEEMPRLAEEIRQFLIEKTALRGGHLASNLGVVEITLAIHRVFDTPEEKVIWDVGHQSYVHKILTGRKGEFDTLRQAGGLSGFPRREEGEFDPFGTGHSSTSVSAALGIAQGEKLRGTNNHTIAVIGDGALTGGLAHEAINNCDKNIPLVMIINENEMSIAPVTGGFPKLVAKMRISRKYRMVKQGTRQILRRIPLIGKPLYRLFNRIRNWVRNMIYQANYFEEMGFHYLGPYDGHDYAKVKKALEEAKQRQQAVVVHFRTTKGKGYPEAERMPDEYHCIYPTQKQDTPHFWQVFGEELVRMGEEDSTICAVTPATGCTTGLSGFEARFPDRTFDVGIAEGHALTFSAGLATMGYKPYAVIYSSFLQRAYDQIIHDVALQNLPVHLIVDRASLAPADGPTHHGIYDVAFLSQVPNMEIFAPATLASLRQMLRDTAMATHPTAIRYANTGEDEALCRAFYANGDFEGYGVRTAGATENVQIVLVSYGKAASRAWEACEILNAEGIACQMLLLERLTPAADVAKELLRHAPVGAPILFFEEGIYQGGVGMYLSQEIASLSPDTVTSVMAIKNPLAQPSEVCDLYEFMGISTRSLCERARELAEK